MPERFTIKDEKADMLYRLKPEHSQNIIELIMHCGKLEDMIDHLTGNIKEVKFEDVLEDENDKDKNESK